MTIPGRGLRGKGGREKCDRKGIKEQNLLTTRRGEKRLRVLSATLNFSSCHEQHMIAACCIIQSCHYLTIFLTYFLKLTFSASNLPLLFKSLLLHCSGIRKSVHFVPSLF